MTTIVKYRDLTLDVDKTLTENTYKNFTGNTAETCTCNNCKNYIAYRNEVFPGEIVNLFNDLGIDYRKEAEIFWHGILPDGLHQMSGWFHFKGQILIGKDYRVPLSSGGHTFELAQITVRFFIGFGAGNDLTFFEDDAGLVQVQFDVHIPWVIDRSLESS